MYFTYNSFTSDGTFKTLGKKNTPICDAILLKSFCVITTCNYLNSPFIEVVSKMSLERRYYTIHQKGFEILQGVKYSNEKRRYPKMSFSFTVS